MTKQKVYNRERIVQTANHLFYEKGYNRTSISDVANQIEISKGNMTYHFRSKDELLLAVIDYRITSINQQLQQWNLENPDPPGRLKRFVQMLLDETEGLIRFGCPMGSLNSELGKNQRDLQHSSRQMFDLFKHWLDDAFGQLGCTDYSTKACHLLSMAQGTALMAYVYSDKTLLESGCEHMIQWIDRISTEQNQD